MSEAANATSTDNNGDSGLNGKLNVSEVLRMNSLSPSFRSEKRVSCMFIIRFRVFLNH